MTKDNRIAEMMKKMEDAFKERDALYKERDEAFQQRYQHLRQLEEALKVEKSSIALIKQDLQEKDIELQKREEAVEHREKQLKEDQADFVEEFHSKMAQLDEEEARLYEMETQLKNEKVRQQIAHIRHESLVLSEKKQNESGWSKDIKIDSNTDLEDPDRFSILQKENENLKKALDEMEQEKDRYKQEITVLEEEKNHLFRKLLGEDPLKTDEDHEADVITSENAHLQGKIESTDPFSNVDKKYSRHDKQFDYPEDRDYMDDLFEYYEQENPGLHWDITDDNNICIKIRRDRYSVAIVQSSRPFFVIYYPVKENQKSLKTIQNTIEKDGTSFHYDHEKNELVIQAYFNPRDVPEDVDNYIRCLVDFEIPELIQKGVKT